MTKRRSIIALFLAVAILALGVGYAAISDTLTIGGTLSTPSFDAKVHFVKEGSGAPVVTVDDHGGATMTTSGTGATTATVSLDMDTIEIVVGTGFDYSTASDKDTITVTFSIVNENDYAVTLGALTPNHGDLNTNVFDVVAAYDTYTAGQQVAAGATVTGTVTITLKSAPTDAAKTGTFNFTIQADPITAP